MFNMDISEAPKAAAETANDETGDHAKLEDMVNNCAIDFFLLHTTLKLNIHSIILSILDS